MQNMKVWNITNLNEMIAFTCYSNTLANKNFLYLDKCVKSLRRANTFLCLSTLGLLAIVHLADCDIKALKLKIAELEEDNRDLNNTVYNNTVYNNVINTENKDEEM